MPTVRRNGSIVGLGVAARGFRADTDRRGRPVVVDLTQFAHLPPATRAAAMESAMVRGEQEAERRGVRILLATTDVFRAEVTAEQRARWAATYKARLKAKREARAAQ